VPVRETRSGLLLAEETAAPREIRDALKKIDPDLILGQEVDSAWSCFVWKVLLRRGDRPAEWLLDWREDPADPRSRPRPLSSALVDEVGALRRGSRRVVLDPLKTNDEMVERGDEQATEETLGISREVYKRSRTLSPVHRSRGLYLARARVRREGRG
jgi:hypothetical protein